MLKPGQIAKKFKSKKGDEIVLRLIDKDDAKDFGRMYNSIIKEGDFVMQLRPETPTETNRWVKEEIKKLIQNQKIQLLAVSDGKIIGQCGIIIEKQTGRTAHVGKYAISIQKDYREQGIGTVLSREAINLAKKHLGIKIAKLSLMEDNKRALALYKKLGFKEVGTIPNVIRRKSSYVGQTIMYREL